MSTTSTEAPWRASARAVAPPIPPPPPVTTATLSMRRSMLFSLLLWADARVTLRVLEDQPLEWRQPEVAGNDLEVATSVGADLNGAGRSGDDQFVRGDVEGDHVTVA